MNVLVLGIDYVPTRVVGVNRAVCMLLAGKAELVEADPDGVPIRSPSLSVPRPSVIRVLATATAPYRRVGLSRRMLIARDAGACQVAGCGRPGTTIDHVLPRSRGGRHEWTNVVLMCARHNNRKADRTLDELGWRLQREPFAPRWALLVASSPRTATPAEWAPYLAAAS
ncbi:MAG: HNH endonuclease [Acidimicrobiia bacterium]|nr:HNH endonuclease [Acidimicrobiia bacterium]